MPDKEAPGGFPPMKEIIFAAREHEVDGDCAATVPGVGVPSDPKPTGNYQG